MEQQQNKMTEIQEWFCGKSVFVTGATGFMGKVLLEKMLRDLPGLKKIYMLMRPKRGNSAQSRLEAIKTLPVFENLQSVKPDALNKLSIIEGNLSELDLGIKEADKKLLIKEICVVYHMAASLRLESGVKDAILQNTLGTQRVFDLCKKMTNLKSVVHLSTAFCHCDIKVLEEKIYPANQDPYDAIKMVLTDNSEELDLNKEKLIAPHPNSYTFSKRLAETVAWDAGFGSQGLPMAIARPSIVIPSLREPCAGWVDSLNGPMGVIVAAGKGVLRSMLVEADNHAEVLPVDVAINGLVAIAWLRATKTFAETPVYNLTQSRDIVDITWGQVLEKGKTIMYENPFEWMLWYPDGNIRTNVLFHNLVMFFFQRLPAYFIDFLLLIFMQERFMIRVQNKISVGLEVLQYFTLREWEFRNKNAIALTAALGPDDQEIFYMANVKFDIEEYMKTAILGARKYCMKENPKSLPFWRMYLKFLFVLHKFTIYAFYFGVVYLSIGFFGLQHLITLSYWSGENQVLQTFPSNIL